MKKRNFLLPIIIATLLTGCSFGKKTNSSDTQQSSVSFSSEQTSLSSEQTQSSTQSSEHTQSSSQETSSSEQQSSSAQSSSQSSSSEQLSSSEHSSSEELSSSQEVVRLDKIELSTTKTDMFVGQSFTLTVSYYPNVDAVKGVTFTSRDASVASVSNKGLVSGLKVGKTTIDVVSTYDEHVTATCEVEVKQIIEGYANIEVNSTYTNNSAWTNSLAVSDFAIEGLNVTSLSAKALYGTGEKSIRFAAAKSAGELTFTFDAVVIRQVKLYVTKYSSNGSSYDNASIKVATSANVAGASKTIDSTGYLVYDAFKNDLEESTTFTISCAAANRFILTAIDVVIGVKDAIYPTSISVSGESEIKATKSTQLKVEYTPKNTNQRVLEFYSSNEDVATVNETGLVTALAAGETTITVAALKEDGSFTYAYHKVTVLESSLDEWTIMIYMCGSNLESGYDEESGSYEDSYLASMDLDEIKSVKNQPDDVNIIVEAGGSKRWHSNYQSIISASKLNRFHLENGKYVSDEQITRVDMGAAGTFQSFLEWGLTNYPAKKTGVILWNHGGGMFGCCNDEISGGALTDDEVLTAVQGAFTKTGTSKLEWIGYDCCLMQIQDVAEFNSPYFNYMVAAQESESGYGWNYDEWVDDLYAGKSTETILTEICDTFIEDNGGVNGTGGYYYGTYYPCDQTLSFLNLNYMETYKNAWEDMAVILKGKLTSTNASTFRKNVIGKTKYFADSDYYYFSEYDVAHFLSILGSNTTFNPGTDSINAIKNALKNLVVYNCAQQEAAHDANGLSFFFGSDGSSYKSYQQSLMSSTYTNFTNWSYISRTYGGSVSSTYSY